MISIITGDIINSRKLTNQAIWLVPLKKLLSGFGKSPAQWEIFRGDSFQVEISDPAESLLAAIRIKATIKSVKGLDVRMAIGIGTREYTAAAISESNGTAFVHSGEKFETLRKLRQRLAISTPWPASDEQLNLMFNLASISMNSWSARSAEMVSFTLQHAGLSQTELGKKIKRTQSSVSAAQSRANFEEITELEQYFRKHIKAQMS